MDVKARVGQDDEDDWIFTSLRYSTRALITPPTQPAPLAGGRTLLHTYLQRLNPPGSKQETVS